MSREAIQGLVAFNGAGVAGTIGLMQRPGPVLLDIKVCGGVFLFGFFAACVGWVTGEIMENQPRADWVAWLAVAGLLIGTLSFVAGVTWAYFIAIHF